MESENKTLHAGHGYKSTHIELHEDGSATIHHVHEHGPHKDKKYAVADLDHVHDGLEEHLGMPNDGEEAEDHDHPSHSELLEEIEELVQKMIKEEKAEGE
jgi:predicted secreted protein